MIRRTVILLSLPGLVLTAGLWIAAGIVSTSQGDSRAGVVVGVAQTDGWLVNARVQGNGFVLAQHFASNPTERSGPYFKSAHARRHQGISVVPRTRSGPISNALTFHIGPFMALFAVAFTACVLPPRVVRWHRRRHSACLACGYSMRDTPTAACPECGQANEYVTPA